MTGTPAGFTTPHAIGERVRDDVAHQVLGRNIDHDDILDREGADDVSPIVAAIPEKPESGHPLTISTTEPGMQISLGTFLDATAIGAAGRTYRPGDGFAMETWHSPDSPNRPKFPGTVLEPDEALTATTVSAFPVAEGRVPQPLSCPAPTAVGAGFPPGAGGAQGDSS